jgi:hypothetical protein
MRKDIEKKQFGDIELSNKVIVSDPCYTRGTWCAGEMENIKPGTYKTFLQYSDEDDWGVRVAELIVIHESVESIEKEQWEETDIHVGVDSGQAGVFCDTIYPHGNSTGDWGTEGTFYHEACEATLGEGYNELSNWGRIKAQYDDYQEMSEARKKIQLEILEDMAPRFKTSKIVLESIKKGEFTLEKPEWNQGSDILGKGLVSSSGYGDGGYSCHVVKDNDEVVAIKIVYIGEHEDEEE